MPTFDYQCQCGYRFEKFVSAKRVEEPQACPDCGESVDRELPSSVSGHFHLETQGVGPQNTGVQGVDMDYDRIIGQSAEKGWKVQATRKKAKMDVLKDNPQAVGTDLSRTPDGDYRVLSPAERAIHQRALANHTEAMARRKQASR